MIRLVYADRAPRLLAALAEGIDRARRAPGASPLDPVPVVVPNQAAAAYLKLALARETGIAANLTFEMLGPLLGRVYRAAHPDRKILDRARLELLLVDLLGQPVIGADPALEPVQRYLEAAGDQGPARALRRAQLGGLLARLFDEYILSRPQMLAAWAHEAPSHPVARWEHALWRHLQPAMDAAGLVPLDRAFEAWSPAPGSVPPRLFVWDVSVGGSVLQTVLARLAAHTELWLHTLNPCLEFWEDVRTGRDLPGLEELQGRLPHRGAEAALEAEDPFDLTNVNDTPALRYWGRPGRENIRLLDALTDCDFESRFSEPDPSPASLLAQVQQDILLRAPERPAPLEGFEGDRSLRITACASLRREVEQIARTVWRLVAESQDGPDPLRFDDVAIALTGRDQDAYRAHIGAVFEEYHRIPHHALDVPLVGSSRVVEAVELLLSLPHSGFTRQDLLRLVTHPVVLSRYAQASADQWLAWCEALAVVHGADHADHAETYIRRDLYNWDQGLRRLVLGTFMSGAKSGDPRTYRVGDQDYLPLEYRLDDVEDAAHFLVLVRSLIADARFARDGARPLAEWIRWLRHYLVSYVTPANDLDERDLHRVLSVLEGLDEAVDDVSAGAQGDLPFAAVAEILRARLSGLTGNRGQPLAEGVVVAPLPLVAGLPFRVVFLPGLGEGKFPSSERRSQLDLRQLQRQPGDVSPRERDQYLFLLRLMATQDSLHISYVSRSAQTGDRLEPAPTVTELLRIVERGYLASARRSLVERQALRRYDPKEATETFDPVAPRRERQVRALRADLEAHLVRHLGPEAAFPDLTQLRESLAPETWRAVSARLRLEAPPDAPAREATTIEVRYERLRRFLEDPLQGWARQVLGLDEQDQAADPFAREDELFQTAPVDRAALLREVFLAHLDAPEVPLEEVYADHANRLELSGRMPTGVFRESEKRRHLDTLTAWRSHLRRALLGRPGGLAPLRFGRAQEHARIRAVEDAVQVALPGQRIVTLVGATEPLTESPRGSFSLLARRPPGGRARFTVELRALLDHALLALRGEPFAGPFPGWAAYGSTGQDGLREVKFAPMSPDEAADWLSTLLVDLLDDSHGYLLPFETVLGLHTNQDKGTRALEEVLAQARPPAYGPLPNPRVGPPGLDAALHVVSRRFGPYFARRQGEDL